MVTTLTFRKRVEIILKVEIENYKNMPARSKIKFRKICATYVSSARDFQLADAYIKQMKPGKK